MLPAVGNYRFIDAGIFIVVYRGLSIIVDPVATLSKSIM